MARYRFDEDAPTRAPMRPHRRPRRMRRPTRTRRPTVRPVTR